MKSRFFTDTQDLDAPCVPKDKISICLCMSRRSYELLLLRSGQIGVTSGEYIDRLIRHDFFSVCGTKDLPWSYSPWRRFPPAPPDH